MSYPTLTPYGWSERWDAVLDAAARSVAGGPELRPARILRHDGVALVVAAPEGTQIVYFGRRLDPEPVVGDWIALEGNQPVAVLPRLSLLRRRAAHADAEHALAANIDVVLLVCGADRPISVGRIHRAATLARDAGSDPVLVLTKAVKADDVDTLVAEMTAADPVLPVLVTSVKEGIGLDELTAIVRNRTVTLLGESGAGKSSIVNALLGDEVAAIGRVRHGDSKGRHTTTTRLLHLLPGGGALIDTPGIRSVGLWVDPDAVSESFADVDELAEECRFVDCEHRTEPGCVILAAIDEGILPAARVEAWRTLHAEAEALSRRAAAHEQRKYERKSGRVTKDAQRRKGR